MDIELANRFYAIGWWGSIVGAIVTATGIAMLFIGTRVRDHHSEQQIATLNLQASQAQERAAGLEQEAATARLELARLRERVTWREIDHTQRVSLMHDLRPGVGNVGINSFNDAESDHYAHSIGQVLAERGYIVGYQHSLTIPTYGITVGAEPEGLSDQFIGAFTAAKIVVTRDRLTWTGPKMAGPILVIHVGQKRPPR